MIDISDVFDFKSVDDEFIDRTEISRIPVSSDIEEAIHNILLRKYYYSTNKDVYNQLFEILTRLGEVPITTIMRVPELHNACTKYIEDKKEDVLYININDDMYEWPQSVSAAPPPSASASASASLVVSPVKGDALTRKKNKKRKKNKQSRKKGNVKNKQSRKIKQQNIFLNYIHCILIPANNRSTD